jgi:CelD/BcsL family acetyltransferase involved in cellulose biosynthesis
MQTLDLRSLHGIDDGALSASAPSRICLSNDLRDFDDLWPRSGRLGAARCYAFQCADILELQCDTFAAARGLELFFVAILGHDGEPLALIPLSIAGGQRLRVLKFLDGGLSDYNAPVVFPPVVNWDLTTVYAIWAGLRKLLPAFDVAVFDRMPDFVGDLPNPLSRLSTSESPESGHAMTLSGTWRDFAAKLPRGRTLRYTRRLSELGTLTFEAAETVEQYDVFVEALIRQKRQRDLEIHGLASLDRPGYCAYLRRARGFIYPSGPVCLQALKINDTIIAAIFGYVVGRRFIPEIRSFDGEWRGYSPGRIAINNAVEWCFSKGLDVFDFGIGDEAYKDEYCDLRLVLRKAVIPTTALGWTGRWVATNVPFARRIYHFSKRYA